jgi:hypothetical protein
MLSLPERLPLHRIGFSGGLTMTGHLMISRLAVIVAAAAGICSAMPAGAEEVGIGVGPGGVTIGSDHGDRYRDRDREVIINKDRDRDRDGPVIINRDRDHGGVKDRDRGSVIIDRN